MHYSYTSEYAIENNKGFSIFHFKQWAHSYFRFHVPSTIKKEYLNNY